MTSIVWKMPIIAITAASLGCGVAFNAQAQDLTHSAADADEVSAIVFVNGNLQSMLPVRGSGREDFKVAKGALIGTLQSVVDQKTLDRISASPDVNGWLASYQISDAGLKIAYDPIQGRIAISLPANEVSASSQPAPPPGETEAADPDEAGAPLVSATAEDETKTPTVFSDRINTLGRDIEIIVPVVVSQRYERLITLHIAADDSLSLNRSDVTTLLGAVIDDAASAALQSATQDKDRVSFAEISEAGFDIRFDRFANRVAINPKPGDLKVYDIRLMHDEKRREYEYALPARTSASLTAFLSQGYQAVGEDIGFQTPSLNLASHVRRWGGVLESDFTVQFDRDEQTLLRNFTRLTYDMPKRGIRVSALDVFSASGNIVAAPDVFGIAVEDQRRLFNPQTNLRTRSFDQFGLGETSIVEVIVNGSVVRRLELPAGNYRFSDLPLSTGANDIQIVATDQFGRREISAINQFSGQAQLPVGEREYSVSLGAPRAFDTDRDDYDFDQPIASALYRYGVRSDLTLGGVLIGDSTTQTGSVEATLATRIGTLYGDVAVSQDSLAGTGHTGRLVYQYSLPDLGKAGFTGFGLSLNYLSESFTNVGRNGVGENSFELGTAGNASFRLTDRDSFALSASYTTFRDADLDRYEIRSQYSRRVTRRLNFNSSIGYSQTQAGEKETFFTIGLSRTFGRSGFGSAEYSSRDEQLDLSYSQASGHGVGTTSLNANATISDGTVSGGGGVSYIANNAELSLSQSSVVDTLSGNLTSAQTRAQIGTSLLYADGAITLARPVSDSFAIVRRHRTLSDASLYLGRSVDRGRVSYGSRSTLFGPASDGGLPSYGDRVINVQVPDAPPGYDIGRGSFRVRPPYRAGYNLVVGSDYTITAIGTLIHVGKPVALVTGKAHLINDEDERSVEIFTNRKGRFGLVGLKPGTWKIELNTSPALTTTLTIPEDSPNLVRVGTMEAEQ